VLSAEGIASLQAFKPSLIFFDIDGTLLNTSGEYSSALKVQLLRLKKQGVKLAIASGRPSIAAQFLFDELPIIDAGLFCTGAELYDPQTRDHIQKHVLDEGVLEQLYSTVKSLDLYCEFYTPEFYTCELDLSAAKRDICDIHSQHLRLAPKAIPGSDLIKRKQPILKLLLGEHSSSQGSKLKALAKAFPQCEFAFAHFLARPEWLFASVVNAESSKLEGFAKLLNYHNVQRERVMAFGDSHSDIVFLQQAGMGISMANAKTEVKDEANLVTFSADEDGVAQALKWIL
jgi:Cof subfamily protein (haloacid dehalogenase superfamily)